MGDKGLKVGDAFVICDAGGGTVDLISYEIVSLKPFELKELVAATGTYRVDVSTSGFPLQHTEDTDKDLIP